MPILIRIGTRPVVKLTLGPCDTATGIRNFRNASLGKKQLHSSSSCPTRNFPHCTLPLARYQLDFYILLSRASVVKRIYTNFGDSMVSSEHTWIRWFCFLSVSQPTFNHYLRKGVGPTYCCGLVLLPTQNMKKVLIYLAQEVGWELILDHCKTMTLTRPRDVGAIISINQ